MAKKALQQTEVKTPKKALVNSPSRSESSNIQVDDRAQKNEGIDSSGQLFSSEEQALEFLVGNIVEKLGEGSSEKAEMTDFLNLLLDTDPILRDEILSGVSVRKE